MAKLFMVILLLCVSLFPYLLTGQDAAAWDDAFYVGEAACRRCHQRSGTHDLFHRWRRSKHAQAYQVLALPQSREIARLSGIDVDPYDSPVCLGCHVTAAGTEEWRREESFKFSDGIQCETCHGPGSLHIEAAAKGEPKTGLTTPDETFCLICHNTKGSHTAVLETRPFDYIEFSRKVAHRSGTTETDDPGQMQKKTAVPGAQIALEYKTPTNLALSPDGKHLYVACEGSDSLMVVDTGTRTVTAEIKVQNQPHGVCLSSGGDRVYVSNRGSDTVSVIEHGAQDYRVVAHIPVGDEPHGLVTGPGGRMLYVANAGSNDISVVDTGKRKEVKRLSAGRGTWDVKRSPGGDSIFITNNLSHFVKFRDPSRSEVTVVDTRRSVVKHRIMIPEANLVQGIDFAPDGEFALVTLLRTKNLIPITRVTRGWMITNGFGILWKDGRVDQLLLDQMDDYFADPTDLVITPDGNYAYITGGGIDAVAVIHLGNVKKVLSRAGEDQRRNVLPNHLGIAEKYVVKRIPVGRSPRGLAVSPDGRFVYVADGLDDTVSVIRTHRQEREAVISLGGPTQITLQRKGERIFHSAEITYGRQFSCHTCHPDGGIDGLTYDIEPDGLGVNPVDNRTLRGILDTAPFKWTGKNPSLSRQCGPRLAVFFTRIDPFTPEQVVALDRYICTIPRNPNRYRQEGDLTEAQRRGKMLFERTRTNSGVPIPKEQRCSGCHSGPYFTNRSIVDVGTRSPLDTHGRFDVPHLNNIYETPPYLHDGSCETLEEIWTRFNPHDRHGVTNDMTKDQLNDLIEYLKTL